MYSDCGLGHLDLPCAKTDIQSAIEKQKKKEDYAFWRQFDEKPSVIPGCPVHVLNVSRSVWQGCDNSCMCISTDRPCVVCALHLFLSSLFAPHVCHLCNDKQGSDCSTVFRMIGAATWMQERKTASQSVSFIQQPKQDLIQGARQDCTYLTLGKDAYLMNNNGATYLNIGTHV